MLKNPVIRPLPLKCGGKVSIQASESHYCLPRDNKGPYSAWEIGFPEGCPAAALALLEEYSDGGDVYSYVPTHVVAAFVAACGGAAGMLLHPFALPCQHPTRSISEKTRDALSAWKSSSL